MINSVCGIRSTGRICTDLAQALEKNGHEVKIAYGREAVPEEFQKYAVRIGSDLDVKVHALSARLLDNSGFGSRRATRKFIKWIKEYDPDIIHLHNIHGYYINIEILINYLKSCNKKIIWTLHDCWAFTGHSAYCDAINCTRWQTGCHSCPQKQEYPKSYIDRSTRNWEKKKELFTSVPAMTIVTPSKWLAGLVKQSFLSKYEVTVIHNGIDTTKFYPCENDFRKVYGLENKFVLLGVATAWDDMKGYSDFIRLSELLDDSFAIVMVGLTDKQLEELPKKIIGIKRTASVKELSYIYSSTDLFLNLTYCDTYPTVNIEAMSCNTPVLTYATGVIVESIGAYDEYNVPKGNLNDIARKIKEIAAVRNPKFGKNNIVENKVVTDNISQGDRYLVGGGFWSIKKELGLLGKYVIICVASVWDRRKGLDDILQLHSMLDKSIYQIIIVGLLEQKKKALPLDIIGITRTNDVEELRYLYSIADIFINTTYEDNYPTTNLEAIACNTPVLTYNTGGSAESAVHYGFVVDKSKVNKIAEIISTNRKLSYVPDVNLISLISEIRDYLKIYG